MTTNNSVDSPLAGTTGTGNFVGSNTPTVTTPKIITSILDTNGNIIENLAPIASAVNYIQVQNNATGANPVIFGTGSDTNVALQLNGKGTGGATVQGTSTNDNATAGYVGEFVSNIIAAASAVAAPNVTATNVTSISLTAGDWDVWGNVSTSSVPTATTAFAGWISSTSATLPDQSLYADITLATGTIAAGIGMSVPQRRFTLSATTTVFLSGEFSGTSGSGSICGGIYARRVR